MKFKMNYLSYEKMEFRKLRICYLQEQHVIRKFMITEIIRKRVIRNNLRMKYI